MKNCRKIQRELSAYLDGELTPSLRANVEEHLALCAQCQQELSEIKTLATGLAALPNLRQAPRFLTEVRRKILRGDRPEPLTWRDHAFRPLWLKIPLEMAALILIIGLIMRSQSSVPTEEVTQFKPGRTDISENGSANDFSSETAAKTEVVNALKSTIADQAQSVETPQDRPAAPGVTAELSSSREVLEKEVSRLGANETPSSTDTTENKQSVEQSAASGVVAGGAEDQHTESARSIPAPYSNGELSASTASTPSSPSPVVRAIGGAEFDQSKPGETVTVHGRSVDDVRKQAQRLAARCSGRIITVPQSKDATEQTFFVELPREYVAAFKLELLKVPGSSAVLAQDGATNKSGSTNAGAPTGVLTGSAVTNNSINALAQFGLGDDVMATASTTVLEIRVVTPAN